MELPTGTVGGLLPVANQNENGLQSKILTPFLNVPPKNLFMRFKNNKEAATFMVAPDNYGAVGPVLVVSCDYHSDTIIRCGTTYLAWNITEDLDAGVYYENGYCNVYLKSKTNMNIIPLNIPSTVEYVLQSVDAFPDDVIWSTKY